MQIFQYWHQARAPDDVEAALASVAAANPDATMRRYHHDTAADYIAARQGPRAVQAFLACAVPAMQADVFRYCAVLAEGGFWLDADHHGVAPLSSLLPPDAHGVLFGRDNGSVVNGCFGLRAPGHPLLATALEIALRGIESRFVEDVWMTTGPGIFTYLHMLAGMTEDERAHLDFDHVGAAVTQSVRLCDAVSRNAAEGVSGLFADLVVAPFDDFLAACPLANVSYKDGMEHWVSWKGSIFR